MKYLYSLSIVLFLPICIGSAQEIEYLVKEITEHKAPVVSVAFSPDGKYLLTAGEDKLLSIYAFPSFEILHKYADNPFAPRALHVTTTNSVFLGSGPDIKLIDLENKTLAVFKGNTTHIWSIAYASERQKITAGSYDYKIKVWDVGTLKVELTLEGHLKSTLPVAFSPDEKYIVSGSLDRSIKIWNAQTGELMRSMEKHSDNIYDIAFHPSGKYFLSCSRDNTIRLWDFSLGEVIKTYAGHNKGVLDVEFLPEGNHFLSASIDGTVRLWELKTGKMVYTYTGHEGAINCISVSTDGKYFASGGADNKVLIFEINKKVFVEYAYYNEFEAEKGQSSLFEVKAKGEKKDEYDARLKKAGELENEIVDKYYQKYIQSLKMMEFKQ